MAHQQHLKSAYEHCERLVRAHYENFPVASVLLPPHMRPHVAAIYAFARTADDYADEPGRAHDERLVLLDDWGKRLEAAAMGMAVEHPIFAALADTIERCDLQVQLLADLLSAFRQDVLVQRYETWVDVMDYCRRSANPVGRLVLAIAGVRNERTNAASDAVCTALQLANFWQDFGCDWRNGRLYVPFEEMRRAGATENDLAGSRLSAPWRATIRACVERTRRFFAGGRSVADCVSGRLRWELRATWLGGVRILDKVHDLEYDTLHHRPTLTTVDALSIAVKTMTWRRTS